MRSCLDLFPQSAITYHQTANKSSDLESGAMASDEMSPSTSSPSFLDTLSAMLTSSFHQTATSALTLTRTTTSTSIPKAKLDALGYDTGIALLHDHIAYVRLNPIVTDCHAVSASSTEGRKLDVPKLLADFASSDSFQHIHQHHPQQHLSTDDWTHYSVTDALPHPFGLPGSTALRYTVALRNVPDGLESLVASPGGVTIHGVIRVVRASEGRDGLDGRRMREEEVGGEKALWLQEEAEVRCWVGMGWYVSRTMEASHGEAHERFRAWWEEEVERKMGGGGGGRAAVGNGREEVMR